MEGHKGPIISLLIIDPKDLFLKTREEGTEDYEHKSAKILSASLDNTIRLWDSKDLSCITIMENDERSELSCMTYLIESGLVATGHEDGHIRLWNLEIGTSVLITGDGSNKMKHKNTVSCIKAIKYKKSEYLACGSFDGTVSIWEISMK
jgi:WD40 repeat protein